ncbi:JNK1/MAPK8-associated membrane protein isoform X2 [Neocloeon triangulifer]|uniref:JNK1/MAPK8-associated membrane protein isoform X2 n=1 Tax=Neocloeon triangulifer TaxID=2078957 RepID=UPI00286F84EC|nr:JNK1/MAPK8-associated membrane protein isoform X2 [Neocloeon triangulifer]
MIIRCILTVCLLYAALLTFAEAFENAVQTLLNNRCPGIYCGRQQLPDGNWSQCGACPRGFRANTSSSACVPCNSNPTLYDWMYLGFMALLPLTLHWYYIDSYLQSRLFIHQQNDGPSFTKVSLSFHAAAFVEVLLSVILTLLLMEPKGSLNVHSCPSFHLSDWYTLLHNPSPDYRYTLHCTQEAAYPLYSMVFVFYALCVVVMMSIRPFLVWFVIPSPSKRSKPTLPLPLPSHGKATIYSALYFLPILALLHALLAGLIYYSFPHVMIVVSLISSAVHFACKEDQSAKKLFKSTVSNIRNMVILLGHWLLHAYGISCIIPVSEVATHWPVFLLVPLPALFYILTAKFTDPKKVHSD